MISKLWILVDFLYWIPSVGLYCLLLKSLLRESRLSWSGQSFFCLIFILGVVDLSISVIVTLGLRLPLSPLTSAWFCSLDCVVVLTVFHWICYSFIAFQFFGSVLIALNRFTAIVFPLFHDTFWTIYGTKLVVCSFLICGGIYADLLTRETRFDPIFVQNETLCVWTDDDGIPKPMNSVRYASVSLICAVVCLIFNSISLVFVCKRQKMQRNAERKRRAETNLLIVAVAIFSCQMMSAGFQIFINRLIQNQDWDRLSQAILYVPWIIDLSSLSSPWILLMISAYARKMVFKPAESTSESNKTCQTRLKLLSTKR